MSNIEDKPAAADPVGDLAKALAAEGDGQAKKKARKEFSEIAAARIWEQLPTTLKTAARRDARAIVGNERGTVAKLTDAGYGQRAANSLLADIGMR